MLLERDSVLAELDAVIAATLDGEGRLVVVEGSAGLGKTAVLKEARQRAHAAGLTVHAARGGQLETGFVFGVVRQLFEATLRSASSRQRADWLSGAAGLVEPLFASPTGRAPDDVESTFAILHGLYWLAANVALARPTALFVDDAHWADAMSLRWLAFAARRLDGIALMVVMTTRPPAEAADPDLLTEILADIDVAALGLTELNLASATALAEKTLGMRPDAAFAAALHTESRGNPLYLVALLDAVARDEIVPCAAQAARVLGLGPEAVARGIAVRLAHLPAAAAEMLRAAAIFGDGVSLSLAAELTGLSGSRALEAAGDLVRVGLLTQEDPIEFAHPVVRSTVIAHMPAAQRLSASRRGADALVARGAPVEQAAAYLLETIPESDPDVVETLRRAARRLSAQGAAASAVDYLRRALAEPPSDDVRADVLHELGMAELDTGAPTAIQRLHASVQASEPARPDLVAAFARALIFQGDMPAAMALLDSQRAASLPPEVHVRLRGHLLLIAQHDPSLRVMADALLAQAQADEARGAAGRLPLAAVASELARRGQSRADALDDAARALSGAWIEEADWLLAMLSATFAQVLAGDETPALAAYDAAIARSRTRGDRFSLEITSLFRGAAYLRIGNLRAAEEDLRPVSDSELRQGDDFRAYRQAFLAEVLLEQGHATQASGVLAEPLTHTAPVNRVYTLWANARVSAALGRAAVALEELHQLGTLCRELGIDNPAWSAWRSQAALVEHRLGRRDAACTHAGEELDRARRWGAPTTIGVALRTHALVTGDLDEQHEAVDVLAASSARLEHARALVDLGAALRRTGSRKDAREHLRAGTDLALRCGAGLIADLGNQELAATGARPRTAMVTGRDTLTASERRVARLALENLSNKDIAQTLFVTVKTVEVHLGRVYRKLEITSRHQLTSELLGVDRPHGLDKPPLPPNDTRLPH